jgi:hypothetical protein
MMLGVIKAPVAPESVLAVAAAAWGVVDEATGERHAWIKNVIAAIVLISALVSFRF